MYGIFVCSDFLSVTPLTAPPLHITYFIIFKETQFIKYVYDGHRQKSVKITHRDTRE